MSVWCQEFSHLDGERNDNTLQGVSALSKMHTSLFFLAWFLARFHRSRCWMLQADISMSCVCVCACVCVRVWRMLQVHLSAR